MDKKILVGNSPLRMEPVSVRGEYVQIGGEKFYKIANFDWIAPFFMSIVSDSDLWMFISSTGALTAGRKNPDHAVFPYYTDDRIHDSHEITGGKIIILATRANQTFLWEPFSGKYQGVYRLERNIYKNVIGNKLIFEEFNLDLAVVFQYAWLNSAELGFIKKSQIKNVGSSPVAVHFVDGVQNLLPYGIDRKFQLEYSTLADGYKRTELQPDLGFGLYTLSAIPTDKAEPSEALKATTVWSVGLSNPKVLLSTRQIDRFRAGETLLSEQDVKGVRGAYFLNAEMDLAPEQSKDWYIVIDTNQDAANVAKLSRLLRNKQELIAQIEKEVKLATVKLEARVAGADGLQISQDELTTARHFTNVLFNIMRGGIFDNGYGIEKSDFELFAKSANRPAFARHQASFAELPARLQHSELFKYIEDLDDPDIEKLGYEYLPLTFSRRHGDPSRPWNLFSIEIQNEQGQKNLNYQGNWRDIFQNWEALAVSFPDYIESMIAKFVNASTADGYNPYRVTREGFDWEVLDLADPWSYIGYWGDHQIIYLLKLLELSLRYHPDKLAALLGKEIFAYANVPYRIKTYEQITREPKSTIDFNQELNNEIARRVALIGTDGKFIWNHNHEIYHVNLTEKLLVTLLAKLTNFVPEAGIWMNTQRPEWNDANNALVGAGASMVTVYYLRRFLVFGIKLFQADQTKAVPISTEVIALFAAIQNTFQEHQNLLTRSMTNIERKTILDQLGSAGSDYRKKIYADGFSETKKTLAIADLVAFFQLALQFVDHSIQANHRQDKLHHAYNLIKINRDGGISIRHLYEMLEGQVAVLSSGFLAPEAALALLDSLRHSALYREDQGSYILYPDRQLPRFIDKNNIPPVELDKSRLLKGLAAAGDKQIIIQESQSGAVHFNGDLRNARILQEALAKLKQQERWQRLVEAEEQLILNLYESLFDHQSFTGRSGTFYKYEGLGCIYWHMVAKLLLAVQENYYWALKSGANKSLLEQLKAHYYDIREGIGVHKSPMQYGAFPTDPYSHTPGFAGVQQPGMTGQVKEDILSRFGELGIEVQDGKLSFNLHLLKRSEFLAGPQLFQYYDVNGKLQQLELSTGMIAFTICQVPIIYILAEKSKIIVTKSNGTEEEKAGLELDTNLSAAIFKRTDSVKQIWVYIEP